MIKTLLPASKLPKTAFFDCVGQKGFQTDDRDVAWELLDKIMGEGLDFELTVTSDKGTTIYTWSEDTGLVEEEGFEEEE